MKTACAIIGSGNIGADLMIKILRTSDVLEVKALIGIDAESDGLARARAMKVATCSDGLAGYAATAAVAETEIFFDATSASAHRRHAELLAGHPAKSVIDLTPAALGPYVVPAVNPPPRGSVRNLNMVTCGGQATIPIVAAISGVTEVHYAEIVASIASRSAGPGTRANIDEFTETTAAALEAVGGAAKGKAIIILNPAEPPLVMRDTVICFTDRCDERRLVRAVDEMTARVQRYVPGFRLKQAVQFETVPVERAPLVDGVRREGLKVSVFLEVEGAGHYLPSYAGNLDIMTSAAMAAGEHVAGVRHAA